MGDQKKGVKRKLLSNSQMSNFPFFCCSTQIESKRDDGGRNKIK